VAPARLPDDVAALLSRFGLSLKGLLTVGASNAKLAKGQALAWPVILHHLPAKALAAAIAGPEAGPTAPRSRIPGLAALAQATGTHSLAMAHNGCPWASAGCAAGCLAWAGHGGLSVTVAAARARRTLAMLADGPTYGRAVLWAIARAYRQAQAKGLPLAVRLRGTDDSPVHLWRFDLTGAEAQALARRYGLPVVPGQGQTLPEALSLAPAGSICLYEYSKAPVHGPLGLQAQASAGFDLTASLAADRPGGLGQALQAIAAGFRLAVPAGFAKGQALPPCCCCAGGQRPPSGVCCALMGTSLITAGLTLQGLSPWALMAWPCCCAQSAAEAKGQRQRLSAWLPQWGPGSPWQGAGRQHSLSPRGRPDPWQPPAPCPPWPRSPTTKASPWALSALAPMACPIRCWPQYCRQQQPGKPAERLSAGASAPCPLSLQSGPFQTVTRGQAAPALQALPIGGVFLLAAMGGNPHIQRRNLRIATDQKR
jgi:hypothetical protein